MLSTLNPIAFEIGPFAIHWYALCILTGLFLAIYLAQKEAPRKKIKPDDVIDFILWAFPLAIVGARLYYVIFQWQDYAADPIKVFAIWEGGIAIYGGLITGAIVLFVYSYYHLINPLDFLDIAAPGVMIAQSIGRWGNFINQEAYGGAVKSLDYLPAFIRDQMYIDGSYRQPTFLYESLWNLLGFAIILVLRRRPRLFKQGEVTFFYLIWYGLGRFVIEGLRTDSLMLGSLRVSQWLSVALVLAGSALLAYRRVKLNPPYYQD